MLDANKMRGIKCRRIKIDDLTKVGKGARSKRKDMGENNGKHEKGRRIYISNRTTEEEKRKKSVQIEKDVSHTSTD